RRPLPFSTAAVTRGHRPTTTTSDPDGEVASPALPHSHRALVGVDDLTPGGEPHALALLHVSDCALQVFDAQGLADDHRMQRNAHDPRLLAAVGVQRIELIDHRAQILLAGVALADVEGDVVDLVAVGNREHFSRLDLHLIGLVVVVPVAAILHAFFGEN